MSFGKKKKKPHTLETIYGELIRAGIPYDQIGEMTLLVACIALGATLGI